MNQIQNTNTVISHSMTGAAHQAGAALFVALVMLLLISIIGVAGVRSVVMEKSMATNSQYEMLVFQGADSAIEGVLADATAFVEAINTATGDPLPTRSYVLDHADNNFDITTSATIQVETPEIPIGFTLGDFVSYPFTINSTSTIATINASDTHVQTATRVAPYLF